MNKTYLIRHCSTQERKGINSGRVYSGIKKEAIFNEAIPFARKIVNLIKNNEKKVLINIEHSDSDRTRLLGEVIKRTINFELMYEHNFQINFSKNDDLAREGSDLPKEILDFVTPYYVEDGLKMYYDWFNQKNDFKNYYPNIPKSYANGIRNYLDSRKQSTKFVDVINIGASHTGALDWYLIKNHSPLISDEKEYFNYAEHIDIDNDKISFRGKTSKLE